MKLNRVKRVPLLLIERVSTITGCLSACVLTWVYIFISGIQSSYGEVLIGCVLSAVLIIGFRLIFRVIKRLIPRFCVVNTSGYRRVLIIGAGSAGRMIANEMKCHHGMKCFPVAFVDDDIYKIGTRICGIKVLGNTKQVQEIVQRESIDEIIISIPSLNSELKKEIINRCAETGCIIKIIPGIYELIEGKISLSQIRNIDVKDLLGREPVTLDNTGIAGYLEGKIVLVTGGGGSIGGELCRQIAKFNPKELLILDIYENNAYDLQNELQNDYPNLNSKIIIASVRDRKRLENIFLQFKPEVVFHAAAHKHVPLMELNPCEAVKNNVFGTLNTAECCDKYGSRRFVLISTDKAVNPTNVMGASKRICEMIIQSLNKKSSTEFVAVRFGNVLGSNGSVIPLFKKQISNGGPVTVTHKDITRYFMTIPEAALLVLQAGAYAQGGEIFVLDMGEPVRIYNLAYDLIKMSGYEPNKDIEIKITGLRHGEKLYEELVMSEEILNETANGKIFVARPTFCDWNTLRLQLKDLRTLVDSESSEDVIRKIQELVPTYKGASQKGDENLC